MASKTSLLFTFLLLTSLRSTRVHQTTEYEHPFKPCPDSPNCVIKSLNLDKNAENLFHIATSVLEENSPFQIKTSSSDHKISAVFRIPVFGFKDDVDLAIKSTETGSVLHIKSASRIGYFDLGVNRRRVNCVIKQIKNKL